MKVLQFDPQFVKKHMDELIHLKDYVPEVSFIDYDKHDEREEFLKSKNLLKTIHEMDQLLTEKCKYSKNPIKARNSIIIEWLNLHPEFEGIISNESWNDYRNMKNNNDFIGFIEFLDLVILPSEKIPKKNRITVDGISIKDDSSIQLPDFDKIDEIYATYPNTLLADYLSYLV